ncbi:SH3 domain-binding protein 2 [Gastrophryne carolinensis]
MATSVRRSKSFAVSVERATMCRVDLRTMASGEPNWPIPMRAIGAQNLLTMPGGVTIAGYLHKRGGKQLQLFKWPLRYVIIHKGCVYYFKSSTAASSQGAFSLNGYNRVMRAAEETTSNNVFPFKMVHISKRHRTWYFSAASEDERKRWMLALRKEIDFYHEKKETITDLSDTGSESDSFYGEVERPVAISYVHNPADDSWQDEDDDEEDYVRPDAVEDIAPSYPPPPIPKQSKEEEPRRSSMSSMPSLKPHLPVPMRSTSGLDLTSSWPESNFHNHQTDLSGIPPPVPSFAPAHKPSQFKAKPPPPPPPPLANTMTDITGKQMPRFRKEFSYLDSVQKNSPSLPIPPRRLDSTTLPSPKQDQTNSQKHLTISNDLKDELNKKLRNTSPSRVINKPQPEKPPNKPNQTPPPLPPTKPLLLSKSIDQSHPPPIPRFKPKMSINNDKLPEIVEPGDTKSGLRTKPPTIIPRSHTPKTPILRSPPDGQSFIDKTAESPVRPPRSKDVDEESDIDSDYEKVPLPPTVFVDTTESADVERLFKDEYPKGILNGLFCIRNSAKTGKVLVTWDKEDVKLRNYRIYEREGKVYLDGDVLFTDIATLVEHYYEYPLPGHSTLMLKHAYGCLNNAR